LALSAIREFLRHEAAGGIVLLAAAALAFILTNSPLADHYLQFFELHLSLKLGDLLAVVWFLFAAIGIVFLGIFDQKGCAFFAPF